MNPRLHPSTSSCSTQASSMASPSTKKKSMASPTLPSDIIIDILSRLPSKTLIRFKSVSKQWYSLIDSPNFINLHLSQTLISDNNSCNLIVAQLSLFSSPISDNHTNPNFHFSKLDHPLKQIPQPFFHISGSINGVVCISSYDKSSIILYNPSTKTHRLVPPFTPFANTYPDFEITHGNSSYNLVTIGFGFDSLREDYKVVRMTETYKNNVPVYREASVYSLSNDSWKCVDDQTVMGQFIFRIDTAVCVNEGLHFIVDDTKSKYKSRVKCFNLQTEKFSIFELPKLDDKFRTVMCVMGELGGWFSVLVNYGNVIVGKRGVQELVRVDLWVMKEYGNTESWFRLFSIRDLTIFPLCTQMRQLVFSKDKQRVLLELNLERLGWYSWGSNTFERITVRGLLHDATFSSWTYLDSLVSLS